MRVRGPLFAPGTAERALRDAMIQQMELMGTDVQRRIGLGPSGRYGHLRDQIEAAVAVAGPRVTGRVRAAGPAAFRMPWVERGTRPHVITPKGIRRRGRRPGALRIGQEFRPAVRHPGMRAQHPMGLVFAMREGSLRAALGRHMTSALRGL
jgi:hypothetical protein